MEVPDSPVVQDPLMGTENTGGGAGGSSNNPCRSSTGKAGG